MTLTPAMQQYYDIKAQYPDAILFFRMGDFYEMFEEDAKIANTVLGIALTTRNKNAENPILLAGIPYHAKEKYLPLLIDVGYKVAIAEQVSDPKLKGIVSREVVRVVTPATLGLEGTEYESGSRTASMVACVTDGSRYGLSVIDMDSRSWKCSEFDTESDFITQIAKISPNEIIITALSGPDFIHAFTSLVGYSLSYFDTKTQPYVNLTTALGVKTLQGFGLEDKKLAQKAANLILEYISHNQKSHIAFLKDISYESPSASMGLDAATMRSLDLVYNVATQSHILGTLFGALNQTKTPMGKHFLRTQILHPLQDKEHIEARQTLISPLKHDPILLDKIRKELAHIGNLEGLLSRLSLGRATPRDLLSLKSSLIAIQNIIQLIESSEHTELKNIFSHLQ